MAREAAGEIARRHIASGDTTGWFDEVYKQAKGDPAHVPWADGRAHRHLTDWLAAMNAKGRALDIGCGIGDNAQALASAGFDVTAFDVSHTAIDWAKNRFPTSAVDFTQADLFNDPIEWRWEFDFINEIYTLQSLPAEMRPIAMQRIARFLKPGGLLLVICRGRKDHELSEGPPWPLSKSEVEAFENYGLMMESFESFPSYDKGPHPRFRFTFRA